MGLTLKPFCPETFQQFTHHIKQRMANDFSISNYEDDMYSSPGQTFLSCVLKRDGMIPQMWIWALRTLLTLVSLIIFVVRVCKTPPTILSLVCIIVPRALVLWLDKCQRMAMKLVNSWVQYSIKIAVTQLWFLAWLMGHFWISWFLSSVTIVIAKRSEYSKWAVLCTVTAYKPTYETLTMPTVANSCYL